MSFEHAFFLSHATATYFTKSSSDELPSDFVPSLDRNKHEQGILESYLKLHQVNFLNRSRAEGKRGILRSTTSRRGAGATSLAGRFKPPPSVTGRITEYEYNGGSDAERTGGRRNKCLSFRPVGGAGADTERGAAGWELRSGGWDEDGTGGGKMADAAAGC